MSLLFVDEGDIELLHERIGFRGEREEHGNVFLFSFHDECATQLVVGHHFADFNNLPCLAQYVTCLLLSCVDRFVQEEILGKDVQLVLRP